MPTFNTPAQTALPTPLPGESPLAFVARMWEQLPAESDQHKASLNEVLTEHNVEARRSGRRDGVAEAKEEQARRGYDVKLREVTP